MSGIVFQIVGTVRTRLVARVARARLGRPEGQVGSAGGACWYGERTARSLYLVAISARGRVAWAVTGDGADLEAKVDSGSSGLAYFLRFARVRGQLSRERPVMERKVGGVAWVVRAVLAWRRPAQA